NSDFRRFFVSDHLIMIEGTLRDAAILNRDFALQGGGQAVKRPSFHLCLDRVWIDDPAAIDRTPCLVDLHRTIRDRDFRDLANDAAECFHDRNSSGVSRGQWLTPSRLLCNQIEYVTMTGVLGQQIASKLIRILPCG